MEPIDVLDGIYDVYDAESGLLDVSIETVDRKGWLWGRIQYEGAVIVPKSVELIRDKELRQRLLGLLQNTNRYIAGDERLVLSDVIDRVINEFGYHRTLSKSEYKPLKS